MCGGGLGQLLEIKDIDKKESKGIYTEDLLFQRNYLKDELESVILREETSWRQKSRLKWVWEGDC